MDTEPDKAEDKEADASIDDDDDIHTDDTFATAFGPRPILDDLVSNLSEFQSLDNEEIEANLLTSEQKSENEMQLEEVPLEECGTSRPASAGNGITTAETQETTTTAATFIGDEFFNFDDDDEEGGIKMEFTCESEKVIESNYAVDEYFVVDDDEMSEGGDEADPAPHSDDNCLQVEIYATDLNDNDKDEEKDDDDDVNQDEISALDKVRNKRSSMFGSAECLGVLKYEIDDSVNPLLADNPSHTITTESLLKDACADDKHEDDNSELSNIMSDHNYTSQEMAAERRAADANTLRNKLVNLILNKASNRSGASSLPSSQSSSSSSGSGSDGSSADKVSAEINDFVDTILESINEFDADKLKANKMTQQHQQQDDKPPNSPIDDFNYDDDRDLFVQNILDAVVAQDAEEEEKEKYSTTLSAVPAAAATATTSTIKRECEPVKSEEVKEIEPVRPEDAMAKKIAPVTTESADKNEMKAAKSDAADNKAQEPQPNISTAAEVFNIETNNTQQVDEQREKKNEPEAKADNILKDVPSLPIADKLPEDILSLSVAENTPVDCAEPMELDAPDAIINASTNVTDTAAIESPTSPMEHDALDQVFGTPLTATENTETSESKLVAPLLAQLTRFAKTLYDDCCQFATSASGSIDEKLQLYINEQFLKLKIMAKIEAPMSDKCLQTERKISTRKLRKLNSKDKKVLLASSEEDDDEDAFSSSSSSSSEEEDESRVSTNIATQALETLPKKDSTAIAKAAAKAASAASVSVEQSEKCDGEIFDLEAATSITASQEHLNFASEYDDGVPLSQYIQSEVFETESFSNENSMSPKRDYFSNITANDFINDEPLKIGQRGASKDGTADGKSTVSCVGDALAQSESDKENGIQNRKSKEKPDDCHDEEDENDKEIERLINLDGLTKRQTYVGTSKIAETDKTKGKSQSKTKNSIIEFSEEDDHMPKDGVSDESMSESDEEIITEKQYLARYNQNLKHQLLNASSSDSEELEHSDDELVERLAADENGNNSPLIDTFLKNFNADESDDEAKENCDTPLPELQDQDTTNGHSAAALPPTTTTTSSGGGGDRNGDDKRIARLSESLEEIKPSEILSDNSDCELLNDNLLYRKRSRPKSLEKMLTAADKRKKANKVDEDLISLSSESDCSDVEAVDVEPEQSDTAKSRLIKPMLRQDQLASETRKAQKHENDRIRRLEKKQTMLVRALKDNPIAKKSGELVLDYIEETKTLIKVHPDIVKQLKPHQVDGVKFMYDSCYGGVEALRKNAGSGCILAHCMGLGKTLQLIALLHTVITYKELKTTKVLVLCPKSTVMNWADEVRRWLGPLNQRNLKVYTFNDTSDINEKLGVMREWSCSTQNRAGCLLIGYEAFRTLVFYHSYKNRGNISTARLEDIRDKVDKYLLQPGADLVVCDEGHIIKNSKSAISLAVSKIITPKRIVLTGTPIQNNLKEYYSMVNFIKPLFLGTEKEFANLYANPMKNGQHKDSSKRDIKVMKQRSFVLHKKLSKFVQRKEAELLKSFLPQKFEYVLFIPMTTAQNNLYEYILEAISRREDNRGRSLITDYTCLRKIWTHPKVLEDAWKNATNQKFKKDARKLANIISDDDQPDDIYDSQTGVMSVTNDWWRHLLTEKDLETIFPSNKLRTMFEILRMCEEKGEKCLIFSAFVAVLNVVEYFFKKISNLNPDTLKELNFSPNKNKNNWISGQDYYRLDGKTPKSIRHEMIKRFNSTLNKRARVFLISAKAGGQGINLTGANRVIILDTSWNPSNDQQNIFRIFRLGQKKNCYIYRLLAMGTMEEKVYSRSVTKQAMSFRVVDEQQIDRHYNMAELAELYILTIPNYSERPMPIFPQDSILASLLLNFPELVYKYHEHDSLLENKVEQELSEAEKADAWAAYERDLQINSEIREMPNVEEMQNSFAAAKMQNYLGSLSGLDMQTLMNYGSLGQQAASSPFVQSLLSQYNYPASNQQYMEMLNLYRKFTQTTMGYPDMSMPDGAFNAGGYAMNAPPPPPPQKAMPNMPTSAAAAVAMLSGLQHHASGATAANSNPLSALGDLSMYGLGVPPKNMHQPSMNSGGGANLTPQHAHAASMFPSPSTSSGASTAGASSSASNNANAMFGHYKQSLESTFQNLFNYSNDFRTSTPPQSAPKPKLPNPPSALHLNQYMDASAAAAAAAASYHSSAHLSPPPLATSSAAATSASSNKSYSPHEQQKATFLNPAPNKLSEIMQQKKPPPVPTQQSDTNNKSGGMSVGLSGGMSGGGAPLSARNPNTAGSTGNDGLSMSVIRRNDVPPQPTAVSGNSMPNKASSSSSSIEARNSPIPSLRPTTTHGATVLKRNTLTNASASSKSVVPPQQAPKTTPVQTIKLPPKSIVPPIQKITTDAHRSSMNMGILYPKSSSSLTAAPSASTTSVASVNMGIVYPTANMTPAAGGAAAATASATTPGAAELLKVSKSSEMQIIPTTSPPGTTSISKQFNEISPSISLTAVRSSNHVKTVSLANKNQPPPATITTKTIAKPAQTSLLLPNGTKSNKPAAGANVNRLSNMTAAPATTSSMKITIPPHLKRTKQTLATSAVANIRPSTVAPSSSSSSSVLATSSASSPLTTGLSSASAIAKTAAAAAVLAKTTTISSAIKSNLTNLTPLSGQRIQPTTPNIAGGTTIKKTIVRRPQVPGQTVPAGAGAAANQQMFNRSNSAGGGGTAASASLYAVAGATSQQAKPPLAANVRTLSKVNAVAAAAAAAASVKRASPTITASSAAFLTAAQKQRIASSSSSSTATTSSSHAVKSTLNIRPVVDSKQNPSGTGVYIIETNINEKRVAIGAPTKSGGGTTVTKVAALQKKRKAQESFPKDISFNPPKQARLGE